MAPAPRLETPSAALADWFFISGTLKLFPPSYLLLTAFEGVESDQLTWARDGDFIDENTPPPGEPTIEEDKAAEDDGRPQDFPQITPRKAKRSSYQRLSRLSDEARLSIASIGSTPEKNGTESNRSSVTIKGIQVNGTLGLNDVDFDRALRKFATERDSFLSDLTLSAGAVVPNRPRPRPKTQRITNEEATGLKSGVESIRRRISFRDMNSMKRPSSVNRNCKLPILRGKLPS